MKYAIAFSVPFTTTLTSLLPIPELQAMRALLTAIAAGMGGIFGLVANDIKKSRGKKG